MKNRKRFLAGLMLFSMTITAVGSLLVGECEMSVLAAEQSKNVDIMFLHDVHSHLDSFTTVVDGEDAVVGGLARVKTLVEEQKDENPNTLVLDAGDFSMGTLVQTVYETEAAELRMLGEIGVEATTFGNHEFDYLSQGLANMLETAKESKDEVPAIVLGNIDWESMDATGLTEGQRILKDAFAEYGVQDYIMITKGDVNIAVFGLFGEDSIACAPTCELLFRNSVEAAKEIVAKIEENEDADMIICLSHGGTNADESKSEDEILAKEVPEIDLIVSGHTHTELQEPIQHGNTYIVSCAEYVKYLGNVSMQEISDGVWEMTSYELIPVRENIAVNEETQDKIDGFMESVDRDYLEQFGYTKDQIVANNNITFSTVKDLGEIHTEHNLGSILSDAYVYSVENADDFNGDPVDVAIAPAGTVRDTYAKGDITIEDVYNSFSLGIGADGIPGYPLVECYLTGKELKVLAEIDASVSDFMKTARLYMSGINFSYNPHRLILNRVTECYLVDDNGNPIEIQDDQLYHVVSDLYSAQMLGAVTDMSFGLLAIVPKYADGTPVEDYNSIIISENGKELKGWAAIANYMESFEDTDGDGIGNVPDTYSEIGSRKVVDDSKNIFDLLKNPNKYAAIIIGVIAILILLIVFIILLVRKLVRRRRVRNGRTR